MTRYKEQRNDNQLFICPKLQQQLKAYFHVIITEKTFWSSRMDSRWACDGNTESGGLRDTVKRKAEETAGRD
ncbi:hypothetical protein T11_12758 [Trichinella zimbabwensis]|uniref:Uncharacterized protein n=1 Tax=Trichinella zimbabwensis TaxID=268475 RepID=A0A0V1H9B9_9BILA|nr:hypothetical protein T11_12758 [Trichinella zimbabwensis]